MVVLRHSALAPLAVASDVAIAMKADPMNFVKVLDIVLSAGLRLLLIARDLQQKRADLAIGPAGSGRRGIVSGLTTSGEAAGNSRSSSRSCAASRIRSRCGG